MRFVLEGGSCREDGLEEARLQARPVGLFSKQVASDEGVDGAVTQGKEMGGCV